MEIHYTDSIFAVQSDGNALLMLTIPKNQKRLYDDIKAFENDILKVMTIEYFKEKRSKDANSGFWLMCDRIAKKVGNIKENIYVFGMCSTDHRSGGSSNEDKTIYH